jgi:MYXO-CTERM domain-containing protein
MRSRTVLATLAFVAMASFEVPLWACGGTFCDSGPPGVVTMPVDQRGENILFAIEDGVVEAHIQIRYQGDAKRFAWILPLPAVPELAVGSQLLFESLLSGTVPTIGYARVQCGGQSIGASCIDSVPPVCGATPQPEPKIVLRATVGAFDVVVLQGGTADEVVEWLSANGYAGNDAAPALLDRYLQKKYVFAAVKLTAGAGVDEIHPLVVRYPGTTPCVPLQLTAVAAVEDMGVRAFFLGDRRVVPTTYRSVVLNPARLDFAATGANYEAVVRAAVDSPAANGHAFVTEYAGPSSVARSSTIYSESWSEVDLSVAADHPEYVVYSLESAGLVDCSSDPCVFNHPLVAPLLHEHLPVPQGLTEQEYYQCISCYEGVSDLSAWDAALFQKKLDERVLSPSRNARDLLEGHPFLTRLYTTISPAEMTQDPEFEAREGLLPVTNNVTAQRLEGCGDGTVLAMRLPDGREIALANGAGAWPMWSESMPWAESVEEFPPGGGAPIALVDNGAAIDAAILEWNASRGWPPAPAVSGSAGAGGMGAPGGTGGTGPSGAGGEGGALAPSTSADGHPPSASPLAAADDDGAMCAVSSTPGAARSGAFVLGVLALLGRGRRRPRISIVARAR